MARKSKCALIPFLKAVRALSFTKKNFIVTKREFSCVLKGPFKRAFSIPNIKAGFAKAGIHPFNPDAVAKGEMLPSTLHEMCSTTSSGDDSHSLQGTSSTDTSLAAPDTPSPIISALSQVAQASESGFTPPLFSTPSSSPQSSLVSVSSFRAAPAGSLSPVVSATVSSPTTINPLVAAGLVSADLQTSYLLLHMMQLCQKRTKRITGARDLTADKYVQMLREDAKKREELEKMKQKRKEEIEQKKA